MNTFLLITEITPRWSEYPQEYSQADMEEIFTAEERETLSAGKPLIRRLRGSTVKYVDMIVAARKIA
jgi:hypothetical protein